MSQGWELRKPPNGDVLYQNEYRAYPELAQALVNASKSGRGHGIPEAIIFDRTTQQPFAVIEVKPLASEIAQAISEAEDYADALWETGSRLIAIALAGTSDEAFQLRVSKRVGSSWQAVTYDGRPISWIPPRADLERLTLPDGHTELRRVSIPRPEALASRADEINRLLRESGIKDEFRPAVVGAIMLALWQSKGNIRKDPAHILSDINQACAKAFWNAHRFRQGTCHGCALRRQHDSARRRVHQRASRRLLHLGRVSVGKADIILTNPPFPHAKTDTPPERFISRSLEGLRHRGRMAAVVPRSLMSKQIAWHSTVLNSNTLDGVIVLPDELFAPYASSYTVILMMTKGIKHKPDHEVFFCRVENDGFRRRKNVRVHTEGEQLSLALEAYGHRKTIPGFCGWSPLIEGAGWDAGYYIPARPLSTNEINAQSATLTRNGAAFVVAHAPELVTLNDAITRGEFTPFDYHASKRNRKSAAMAAPGASVISSYFHIYYGQKSLHNKDGLTEGKALVISSSGIDNGCYGFFDFPDLIHPPFVTVPSTGSIGRAHVQKWPCGVTDDCLVLIPKEGVPDELLYVAAAVIRQERWRFNYGRKITPERIANYPVPNTEAVLARVREHIAEGLRVERVALEIAEDALDAEIAAERLAEIEQDPTAVLSGDALEDKMKLWLS